MHLYDDREMTFSQMKKILSLASSGNIEGTEKTDGYNIFLGVKEGQPRAARNKGDMVKGGMTAGELAARDWAGGEAVRQVYLDSFRAFSKAVESLNSKELAVIFGPGGEIFYNTEIQGPGASNVVNYDANVVSIHRGGHRRYVPETNSIEIIDATEGSTLLDQKINQFEEATRDENFSVKRTAMMKLQALDDDYDLKIVLSKIQKAGFSGSMTIEQFLEIRLGEQIEKQFGFFSENIRQDILDRMLQKENKKSMVQIYRGMPKEQKVKISEFIKSAGKRISNIMWPIEEAIHDFAVALLEGMQSAYILDNTKELKRLKSELKQAIAAIKGYAGPQSADIQDILIKQLNKIKHHDNVNTPVEGFVFEFPPGSRNLYKFTGNFAPVNQILGLFRYGRKGVKIPKLGEETPDEDVIIMKEEHDERIVALIPGKFKPPHGGHLEMVAHYADLADEVIVLVSPLSRAFSEKGEVTVDQSIKIWEIYFKDAGLTNAKALKSPKNSPVGATFEFVSNDDNNPDYAQPGDQVILGTSTKGGDESRFAGNVQQYAREGVEVLDPMKFAFSPTPPPINATDFRRALARKEDITPFLPETSQNEDSMRQITDLLGVSSDAEKKILSLEHLYSLVDDMLLKEQARQVDEVFGKVKDWWKDKQEKSKREDSRTHELEVLHGLLQNTDHISGREVFLSMPEEDKGILARMIQNIKKRNPLGKYGMSFSRKQDATPDEILNVVDNIAKQDNETWLEFARSLGRQYMEENPNLGLEEISAAGGVGGSAGSVEGAAGPYNKKRKRKPETLIREDDIIPEEEEIMQVDREQYIEEQKLRKLIRKGIGVIIEKHAKEDKGLLREEQRLRSLIRDLINEGGTPTGDASPHRYTGINVLEKLLKKIIPVLEQDYKQLTSSEEQRQSFRSHIVNAAENALAPVQVNDQAPGDAPAMPAEPMMEQEEEDIDVTIDTDEPPEEFIDVGLESDKEEAPSDPKETEKDEFGIDGANVTGRNAAFETFKQIENQIVDSYGMLADEKDKEMFYDYLITNLKLYFDKFEEDLAGSIEEPTTDEYEAEKSAVEEPAAEEF